MLHARLASDRAATGGPQGPAIQPPRLLAQRRPFVREGLGPDLDHGMRIARTERHDTIPPAQRIYDAGNLAVLNHQVAISGQPAASRHAAEGHAPRRVDLLVQRTAHWRAAGQRNADTLLAPAAAQAPGGLGRERKITYGSDGFRPHSERLAARARRQAARCGDL